MVKQILNTKAVPRWVILLVDLAINAFSFMFAYFIVKHFEFPGILRGHFFFYSLFYCAVAGITFYCMGVHMGLIRYSNIHDIVRIFTAVLIISAVYPLIVHFIIAGYYDIHTLNIGTVLLINFFISSSLLILLRIAVKETYHYLKRIAPTSTEKILIFGSGNNALLIKQALESGDMNRFVLEGFIETNASRLNTSIQQKKVYGVKDLPFLKNKKNVTSLLLINEQRRSLDKKFVIERCLKAGIKVLTLPSSDQWVYGKLNLKEIQELRIEDLLQREPIKIDNIEINSEISGRRVLITGAAGSIGSEIVRQVISYSPEMVVLCDQAESALHEIQLEIEEKHPDVDVKIFIGSIRDYNRMEIPFKEYRPHIVFHAAAYKHVPMMEHHPVEAVLTNVGGTKNLADLSILFQAEKFVMISTDKAVNPTNVMGTSKRIAEMYVQSLSMQMEREAKGYEVIKTKTGNHHVRLENTTTKFITTRFGNVLNSNGSVIPRFKEQIKNGGPVTVTHPDITRYFMTIPEAVQLVLEACTMGFGGEIFVFDMGKPVKIIDLAKNMIQLAGFVPGQDIEITFTGLRPGEKLYEELLSEEETTLPTHHEKIKIAKVIPCTHKVRSEIENLITMSVHESSKNLVRKMKELVPEYKSKNSRFEELDEPVLEAEEAIEK